MEQGRVTPEYMAEWAKHAHGSPLYQHLAHYIGADPDLLRVTARVVNRPPPNVLFAAVHYLLMGGADPTLAAYYPSLTGSPLPVEDAGEPFRRFVLEHEDLIVEMGRTRYTQTNECRRCVALLPMVMMAPFTRFHLVDVGASAGLNLALDRYRYRFDGREWGPRSPVLLETELRGAAPSLHQLEVMRRIGLDLDPVDTTDPEQRLWLDALIWPEHAPRRARLRAALALVGSLELNMVAGDAVDTLPQVLEGLPDDEPVVVMASFVLIQVSAAQRERLDTVLVMARERRPIFQVSMEVPIGIDVWARLVVDDGTGPRQVGTAHPHGEWVSLEG